MEIVSVESLVEELMECSDSELDDRVRALELERRRVEAELALAAGEIDRRRSYLDDGHRSLKAYLRATCNYSDAEAARVGRLTTVAAGLPGVAEALHDGHIGTAQANELAVAHSNRRVRNRLAEFAPMLIELAERLSFREFRTCVQRFVMLADLDGAHRDLDESIANRRARVVNLNGSLCLDGGGGDPLVNVELEAIFQYFCELEYDADVAARRTEYGDRADGYPLPRTAAQRSYDAFVAIMRGALANHQAGRAAPGVEPLVNILTDHRTFGAVLAQAGLAPDTNLAGETVDPFTGLASPGDLLEELMADPDGPSSATTSAAACPPNSAKSTTRLSGTKVDAPIRTTPAPDAAATTTRSIESDGAPGATSTDETTPSEPTAPSCSPSESAHRSSPTNPATNRRRRSRPSRRTWNTPSTAGSTTPPTTSSVGAEPCDEPRSATRSPSTDSTTSPRSVTSGRRLRPSSIPVTGLRSEPPSRQCETERMAFGQSSGPPATHSQLHELTELLQAAGHSDFRDARGPMGFTQRQANGKFTRDEADEFIAALQEAAEDTPAPPPPPAPVKPKAPRPGSPEAQLAKFSDEQLAAELQRRNWVVMEP